MTDSTQEAKAATQRSIEKGIFAREISNAGQTERYGRGKTSHAGHVWWARRPHSAMRALVFASLCREAPNDEQARSENAKLTASLSEASLAPREALEEARARLRFQYGRTPRVLDLFAGGATIPLEACNLGAEAVAIDSNALAVFINRWALEYGQGLSPERAREAVLDSGARVLDDVAHATAELFPLRRGESPRQFEGTEQLPVTTYLWSYFTRCADCGFRFSLSRRRCLSSRQGLWLHSRPVEDSEELVLVRNHDSTARPATNWRRNRLHCPRCEAEQGSIDIERCEDALSVLVRSRRGRGKSYHLPSDPAIPSSSRLAEIEARWLEELGVSLPSSELPRWSGVVNPPLHGLTTHAQALHPRQRLVVLALIGALRREHARLATTLLTECHRLFVTGALTALVDQAIDWSCRLSMWIPQNEQIGRALSGPGVPMIWDYAEMDPALEGPAGLRGKVVRIAEAAAATTASLGADGRVIYGSAERLDLAEQSFDAVVTDPPYYDNIVYTALADFLFAWKRLVFPELDLFAHRSTDTIAELIASRHRHGSSAHSRYVDGLARALNEGARVLRDDGVLSLVYAHASIHGWAALVEAFSRSTLELVNAQPLSVERRQRPRAMSANAVHTGLVFVGRRSSTPKPTGFSEELVEVVDHLLQSDLPATLIESGWDEIDAALVCFAHGLCWLGNRQGLLDLSSGDAIVHLESRIRQRFHAFSLARRRSI